MTANQCFIFLLSSKAGGMGLNLVGANRLVMFDADFNPAIDAQAMARIYRPGQTKPTTIYRLFTAGTMEETVLQRQEQKGTLATVTVDGSVNNESGKFTNEELRDCFTLKEDTCCDTKSKMKSLWPEYDGSKSLSLQGCSDPVILNLSDNCAAILGHVHLVPVEASSTNVHMDSIMDIDDLSAHDTENDMPMDSSDEEEFEFDD
jgi:DNA repair and recombination RAD54-like protein